MVADPAYEYSQGLQLRITLNQKTRIRKFPKRDQFAAELVYFSDCILQDKEPEPSGVEGLADVRIMEASYFCPHCEAGSFAAVLQEHETDSTAGNWKACARPAKNRKSVVGIRGSSLIDHSDLMSSDSSLRSGNRLIWWPPRWHLAGPHFARSKPPLNR